VVPFTQLHELLNQGVYQPVTNEWLGWLCDWLMVRSSNKEIMIETVGNMTRYIKEKENSTYQIISASNQLIEINVTDDLDNEIYNYPLSAYLKIPNEWNYVRTEQNGNIDTLTTIAADSGRVVLANVIPDGGILKLTPVTSTSIDDEFVNAAEFQLYQNYPNPFNPKTKISYAIPDNVLVELKVYNTLGQEVATLVKEEKLAGNYEIEFNADDLPSGIYFYNIKALDFVKTKKMILLK